MFKNKENVGDLQTQDGTASTDQEKANALSSFFKQVFTQEDTSAMPFFEPRTTRDPLEDVSFSQENVKKLLYHTFYVYRLT